MEAAVRAYQSVTQKEVRDKLVVDHLDYVRHVLGRVIGGLPDFVDSESLESAGILGLVEAATQFDPSRGVEFRTFAHHRIRGAILDELRRNCPLPQQVLKQWSALRQAWEKLGEHATPRTLAQACQITEEEVEACLAAVRLTRPEEWHEGLSDWRKHHSQEMAPHARLDAEEEQQILADAIEELPERLRIILSLYFLEDLRLQEIGEVLGLSESRVSRLLVQAQMQVRNNIQRKQTGSPQRRKSS
jgi:RNA polymerase sigma factor for flagellar operon FliA